MTRGLGAVRAAGIVLAGAAADAVFGDPRRWHPVAGFGRGAGAVERVVYRDSRVVGVGYAGVLVAGAAVAGQVLERRWPVATAVGLWVALGGRSLAREGERMGALLAAGDLAGARERLPHLCGRDPAGLPEAELVRATVESVAENTSDAAVAPLLYAVAGLPGVLAYRAANTLDAMVGHRSARYARFGWGAARLDDLLNLAPARLTAALACGLAPLVGGSPTAAARVLRRDGGRHPSPNAGRCEAAFAGALGVQLGGSNTYAGHTETRGRLGDGRPPAVGDIARAVRLSRAVVLAGTALAATLAGLRAAAAARRRPAARRAAGRRGAAAARRCPGVQRRAAVRRCHR